MQPTESRAIYEFGDFRLDRGQRLLTLKADGRVLPLVSRAFDTLLYLVERPGDLVGKAELLAAVWPGTVVEENNLNQSIAAIRRALGERAGEHKYIVTIAGRGFRFVAPVREALPAEPKAKAEARSPARWRSWAILAAAGVVLIAVAVIAAHTPRADGPGPHAGDLAVQARCAGG